MSDSGDLGPLAIDPVDSHARLRGDDVEVVLCGLAGAVADPAEVILSRDGSAVTAPAEVRITGGTHEVRARTPRGRLGDGHWSLALVTDDAERVVDARLLVQGRRPLVLLLGAEAPRSVVPRRRTPPTPPGLARRVVRRLVRTVRR